MSCGKKFSIVYVNIKIDNAPRPEKYQLLPFVMMVTWVLGNWNYGDNRKDILTLGSLRLFVSLESGHTLES